MRPGLSHNLRQTQTPLYQLMRNEEEEDTYLKDIFILLFYFILVILDKGYYDPK